MKKILAVLASLSLTSALSSSVLSCGKKPEPQFAEDEEIFSVEPQHAKLEIDNDGNQVEDFNFNLNYVLTSPTTGDATNVDLQSAIIATEDENASDDTRRNGEFFSIEEIESSHAEGEPQVNYRLKFNSEMIGNFKGGSLEKFNLALHFKGTYFADEEFGVTLYFKFDFINNYRADLKHDLKDYISEEERNLGLIEELNDVIPQEKAQDLIKVAVYKKFRDLVDEVDLNFAWETKQVQIVAKLNSEKFHGDVTLNYVHDQNPQLLPDVSEGIDLKELAVDRLAFSKLDLNEKIELIKVPLKQWYLIEKGQDYTDLYFQYFKVEDTMIDVDTTEVLIKFETPWSGVNKDFQARFKIPYASMAEKLPADLFAEKLLDMNPTTSDRLIFSKLSQKANEQIPDFDDLFEFGTLDVVKQTIEIVVKTKEKDQIYEPQAKLKLNFNVQKLNLEDLLGAKLKDYSFNAKSKGVYYMTLKEFALGKMRNDIYSKLTVEEKTLITLNNEFNELNFDTTDPDKWTVKITPSLSAQRYATGEIAFQYENPSESNLDIPVDRTYDTPGRDQTIQLDAPFLVSSQEEVQASYLKTLNEVCAANPFSKWIILDDPQDIDVTIPNRIFSYDLYADAKVTKYLNSKRVPGRFKLTSLDLENYFFGGIQIATPLESTTPSAIAEELYEMIIGTKESDFKPIPNFENVVEVIDVSLDSEAKTGTAVLRVRDTYPYKGYVLNQAEISFTLKEKSQI